MQKTSSTISAIFVDYALHRHTQKNYRKLLGCSGLYKFNDVNINSRVCHNI